jgi:hypothetical protein
VQQGQRLQKYISGQQSSGQRQRGDLNSDHAQLLAPIAHAADEDTGELQFRLYERGYKRTCTGARWAGRLIDQDQEQRICVWGNRSKYSLTFGP